MNSSGDISLRSLLALFAEPLVEVRLPRAGGGELTCAVFQLGEVAALAAALRLAGWRHGGQLTTASEPSLTPASLLTPSAEPGNSGETALPESVTDLLKRRPV